MSFDGAIDDPRVLVTGGSGFIGTNLIERLLESEISVKNVDTAIPANPDHGPMWEPVDINDRDALIAAVTDFDPTHVFHLAARTDLGGATVADYVTNTQGTAHLIEALARLEEPPVLLVASTRMVCRIGYRPSADDDYCPPNAYGQSKVETERILHTSGYPGTWLVVRPTSIWGPWFGVPYRDFFLTVAKGRYRHPARQRMRKSFGYVENTVHQLIELAGSCPETVHGRTFYVADYEPIEVFDWATRIHQATGGPPIRTVPLGVLKGVATGGDLLKRVGWREPPLTSFRLANLLTEMVHDLEPVRAVAPDLPVSLDDGVSRTAAWLAGALQPRRSVRR